jgi:CheY-like chemotaxis protein
MIHAPNTIRVLVVDDEFIVALDISQQLEDAGFEVVGPASNTEQALELINKTKPDLALLDVNLGTGKTSYDVARCLASQDIPYVFLSGYSRQQLSAEFHHIPTLAKPCPIEEVLSVMATLRPDEALNEK